MCSAGPAHLPRSDQDPLQTMSKSLVIVESPAKAKTINKYLGSDYKVLASYGHVRDLPPKDGSVLPDDDFRMLAFSARMYAEKGRKFRETLKVVG